MAYPPVHQRPAWTQPLTVISDPVPPQVLVQDASLPQLRQVVASTTATWDQRPPSAVATIRSRPLSAGAMRNNRVQAQSQSARGKLRSQNPPVNSCLASFLIYISF